MSFLSFHHGTRLQESNETPVLVQVAQTAVVGLMGTAPDADPAKFPINTPVLLKATPRRRLTLARRARSKTPSTMCSTRSVLTPS